MQLNDFHVLDITYKQTGTKTHRDVVYDDVQTFIDEIYMDKAEDYTFNEIPRKDWTTDDCINVTSELLKKYQPSQSRRRTACDCGYHATGQHS